MAANESMYRKVALERLSSPEDLDALLRIADSRAWFAMIALFLLLFAASIWTFTGTVVSTASGVGVIAKGGGVFNIVAGATGFVVTVNAKAGDSVHRGDVLATIAQPILFERVKSLELALAEAQQSLSSTARTSETSTGLQIGAIEQRHSALNGQLAELREEQQITIARVKDAEQLQQKGLLTTPQVLELKEKVTGINDQMTNMNVEIKQLNSQEYGVRAQPQKEIEAVQERVNSLSSELAAARAELAQAQTVISPDDGEIIEREVDPGSMVSAAQPLLSVQRSRDNLEVIAYVPSLDAKSMNTGMDAQISPSNIRREEYGFINGRVMYVAQFPSYLCGSDAKLRE